jgi:hypothetical protein
LYRRLEGCFRLSWLVLIIDEVLLARYIADEMESRHILLKMQKAKLRVERKRKKCYYGIERLRVAFQVCLDSCRLCCCL